MLPFLCKWIQISILKQLLLIYIFPFRNTLNIFSRVLILKALGEVFFCLLTVSCPCLQHSCPPCPPTPARKIKRQGASRCCKLLKFQMSAFQAGHSFTFSMSLVYDSQLKGYLNNFHKFLHSCKFVTFNFTGMFLHFTS